MRLRTIDAAAALGLALTLAGCSAGQPPAAGHGERDARPSILLVTVDALRADHLGVYGYQRPTSPFLDRLAASSTVWEQAYSTSSWTVPAVVSLLSGVAPRTHGVVHGVSLRGEVVEQEVIPAALPLVAETLRASGYATFAVVTNPHLSDRQGFARGFDRFEFLPFADAVAANQVVEGWAPDLARGPVFVWVHYFDPHHPYYRREPHFTAFAGELAPTAVELDTLARAQEEWPKVPFSLLFRVERTMALLRGLYDSEIRYWDDSFAALWQRLPLLDDFAVVVTADHGEEFRDHGRVGHGNNLYDSTTRIPLLIRSPRGGPAARVSGPVSLVDIPVTLAHLATASSPSGWQGQVLADHSAPTRSPPVIAALSRFPDQAHLVALVSGRHKLVQEQRTGLSELYDLGGDPGERVDLAPGAPAELTRLQAELAAALAAVPEASGSPLTVTGYQGQVEALRALGYVE